LNRLKIQLLVTTLPFPGWSLIPCEENLLLNEVFASHRCRIPKAPLQGIILIINS
jgi:hypothetical protein